MTDPDHTPDLPDPTDLTGRMERAVGGLHAPDVLASAMTHGRRHRTHRRLAYGAGGLAAVTALVLAVPALAGGGPGADPVGPQLAADPTSDSATATSPSVPPASATLAPGPESCESDRTGWWSKSSNEVRAELAALLPAGTRIGSTDDRWAGSWGGNLVTGDDADFASLELLPPPGVRGAQITIAELSELSDGGPCAAGANRPMQPVEPCPDAAGPACQEIRDADGELVGVVTEKVEQTVVDGQDRPTDKTYVMATLAVAGGGHVELYVGEGTRADRPSTVHDPADVPALTPDQARAIVLDPVWTS